MSVGEAMTRVKPKLAENNVVDALGRAARGMVILIVVMVLGAMPLSTPCRAQDSSASKVFVIYFRHGASDVTAEAYQVLRLASDAANSSVNSKIVVTGYCDTSEQGPRELSGKRAQNTVAALRAAGLSGRASVQMSASGSRDLAVPTPAGTSEPLNRRAQIEIWFGQSASSVALDAQLMAAAQMSDPTAVARLLTQGANIEAKDRNGNTPLMLAASAGRTAVVRVLLSKGADTWAANDAGKQPTDCALDGHHYYLVRFISRWGSNQSLGPLDKQLFDAVGRGDSAAVTTLLTEGAHIDARDLYGDTPLMQAVLGRNEGVVKLLLDHGASVEARNTLDKTPLMEAYNSEVARWLILKGARVEARTNTGQTALMLLAGNTSTVRLLLDAGANPNAKDDRGRTALDYAQADKNPDAVQLLSHPQPPASPSANEQAEAAPSNSASAPVRFALAQSAGNSESAQSNSGPDWSQSDPKEWPERTRALLKDFNCPDGDSPEACATFQKLAAAGDQELAAQFSIMFLDRKYFFPLVLVAFEGKRDQFWIVTVLADRAKGALRFWRVTYAHYIAGTIVASAYGDDIPFNGDSATFTSHKHNDVSLLLGSDEDTTVNAVETDHLSDGRALTVKLIIEKSHSPEHWDPNPVLGTITYDSGTFHETQNVKVARFFNK